MVGKVLVLPRLPLPPPNGMLNPLDRPPDMPEKPPIPKPPADPKDGCPMRGAGRRS
jgi:hypothetical protein